MVNRYVFIGLLVSGVGSAQGAQLPSGAAPKVRFIPFEGTFSKESLDLELQAGRSTGVERAYALIQRDSQAVTTLEKEVGLLSAAYYQRFQDTPAMAAMNEQCGVPATFEDVKKTFENAFTVPQVQANQQILFEAYDIDRQKLAAVLFMFHLLAKNEPAVTSQFELGFIATDPDYWRQGISSALAGFAFERLQVAGVVTPARPTNTPFTNFLGKIGFVESREDADRMRQGIIDSPVVPEDQKEIARKDMTAYRYTQQQQQKAALGFLTYLKSWLPW